MIRHTPNDAERRGLSRLLVGLELPEPMVGALSEYADILVVDEGDIILREGDPVDAMAVVVSGRVRSEKVSPHGKHISLMVTMPGDDFGGLACMAQRPFPWRAVAAEDSVLALLSADELKRLICEDVDFSTAFHVMQATRFRTLAESLQTMQAQVPVRLARYIAQKIDPDTVLDNKAGRVDLVLERAEIAWTLGTAPETLSRAYRQLHEQGLVSRSSGRVIAVLDVDGITEMAQQ